MNKRIVLISGPASSGKNTVADILTANYRHQGLKVEQSALADKLKEIVCDLFGLSKDLLTSYEHKARYRYLLTKVGRQMRDVDPHVWATYLCNRIDKSEANVILVPDLRFFNEFFKILERNQSNQLHLIRVNASPDVRMQRIPHDVAEVFVDTDSHLDESETQMDILDCSFNKIAIHLREHIKPIRDLTLKVENNKTVDDLEEMLVEYDQDDNPYRMLIENHMYTIDASNVDSILKASYHLSHNLGPELKLIVK